MQEIEVQVDVAAEPREVWARYAECEHWPEWTRVKEVVVRQPGDPSPYGLGSIRVVRVGGLAIEEETLAFDPPKRLAYRITEGAPLKNHDAEVLFEPTESGTRVTWRARFQPRIPFTGPLVARMLRTGMEDMLPPDLRTGIT